MQIIFNLLTTLKPKTGVGHYAARLFAALGEQLPNDSLHGFPKGILAGMIRGVQAARPKAKPASERKPTRLKRPAVAAMNAMRTAGRGCINLAFRAACRNGRFDVYHEPNFLPLPGGPPGIVTVHDLSVVLHPEWHPADRVRHHERFFLRGLAQSRHVITVSRFVRRQVVECLGVAADRVTAVHNGVGPEYFSAGPVQAHQTRRELKLPPRYLLFVGTIEPRKNLLTLLRAYCDLDSDVRESCPLVLAGGWGWKSAKVADFIRSTAADKGVIHLGYTDDRLLPGLYAGARALVFPSFDEGFGLPPLEMLATGGAVLSSPTSSLSEVLGPHAQFIDPHDPIAWRERLRRAATDDDWLATIRRGGRDHAAAFTWERCAAETIAVYRGIAPAFRKAA